MVLCIVVLCIVLCVYIRHIRFMYIIMTIIMTITNDVRCCCFTTYDDYD